MTEYYNSTEEWLNDPDPYGEFAWCDCGYMLEIKHHDVFHEGVCSKCGTIYDEPCIYHGAERGKCQLKVIHD